MDKELAEAKYNRIIERARNRKKYNGIIYERHHIKPRSLFPSLAHDKNNIVNLTCYEHIQAHYYLCFIYPGEKTRYSFYRMSRGRINVLEEDSEERMYDMLNDLAFRRSRDIEENYDAPFKKEKTEFHPHKKEKLRKRMSVSKMNKKNKVNIVHYDKRSR